MNQEDIERVAQAIRVALYDPQLSRNIVSGDSAKRAAAMDVVARAALSAMPGHELLREALEALDRQRVWHEGHDKTLSKQPPNTDVRWRRLEHQEQAEDARAAADKIRAAMGGEKP